MSCVTSSVVRGSDASAASQPLLQLRAGDRVERRRTARRAAGRGLPASSVRAKATRWRIPPDSSSGRARANSGKPEALEQRQRPATRVARGGALQLRARARRCRAPMRHGSSRSRCGIRTHWQPPWHRAYDDLPAEALRGRRSPPAAWTCRNPTAPRSRAISPASTANVTSCSARRARRGRRMSWTARRRRTAAGRLLVDCDSLSGALRGIVALPSRVLPHRFEGSAPGGRSPRRYLSPLAREPP